MPRQLARSSQHAALPRYGMHALPLPRIGAPSWGFYGPMVGRMGGEVMITPGAVLYMDGAKREVARFENAVSAALSQSDALSREGVLFPEELADLKRNIELLRGQIVTEIQTTQKVGMDKNFSTGGWEAALRNLRNLVDVRIGQIVDFVNAFRSIKCLKSKQDICARSSPDACPAPCAAERLLLVGPKRCVYPDALAKKLSPNAKFEKCPYAPKR